MQALWRRLSNFHPSALLLPVILVSLLLVSLLGDSHREAVRVSLTGIYKNGHLTITIPYSAPRAGSGTLTVELLDPEDHVLGHVQRRVDVVRGDNVWKQDLKPANHLPIEDLAWQRIRFQFQYKNEDSVAFESIHAVSEILRRPIVHIIGQSSYLAGAQAAIRVIVTNSEGHEIAGNSSVGIELLDGDKPRRALFQGRVNQRGTTEAQFRFPVSLKGDYQLRFVAETPLGTTETMQSVRLEDKTSILLTTEKRIYQPGQTIHVRTLVLDRSDHHAVASGQLTFELLDPRGNKVFKQMTATDEYGIASAEFPLADEVNLGTYQLHALMGNPETSTNQTSLSITVDRYVLPKFKVAIDFPSMNGKPKRDYRPGDHVTGTVQSNYFFGKSIANREIKVKTSSMDVQLVEAASATGRTDKDGFYHFDLRLPSFFAGRLANGGSASVLVEATVKDESGHSETRGEGITVSDSSLLVTAVPEGGTLIPGLENQVFLLASYLDGTAAAADLHVHSAGTVDQTVITDSRGVAMVRITPEAKVASLKIKADDHQGNHVSKSIPLEARGGTDQILLRPDRAVYKPGDLMQLSVFSTTQHGTAFIDIVKDSQTILTRDLDLTNGRAQLNLAATTDMSGTLAINVYRLSDDGQTLGDHRLVFVRPADELRIQAIADALIYKPGTDAHIEFRVTNEHGRGVRAALGLQVVDEAVFSLSEKQPGFAKAFFYLEQELLKPRYEIHTLTMPEVVEPTTETELKHQDRAAQALFSATEIANPNNINIVAGKDMPDEKAADYQERYRIAFEDHVSLLVARVSKRWRRHVFGNPASLMEETDGSKPRDAWGTLLRIEPTSWQIGASPYLRVISAGMDRHFGTADDFSITIDSRSGVVLGREPDSSLVITIDQQRGMADNFAELNGSVTDPAATAIQNATVTLGRHTTATDPNGLFKFSGISPGSYKIQIVSPGFQVASRWITLHSRDVASVAGMLGVGSVSQTVEVTGAAPMLRMQAVGGVVAALPMMARATEVVVSDSVARGAAPVPKPAENTHIRSYFPEALYINPEIITDRNGFARISIPIADSITDWRLAMLASTTTGALGTANSSIKVFQDFFVDLDLPATLTQSDVVTIPVAVYNYAGHRGDVSLSLENENWFELTGDSSKSLTVEPGRVGSSNFTLEAKRIGHFKLKLSAKMKGVAQRQDIVVREIEVVPNGREQSIVFNGHLDSSVQHTVRFPDAAIPDASKLVVRLYPGPLSQIVEGMDAILQMPGGCFEQTSSSTYPNILALDYMKRTKKLTPEVHAKAEGYIVNGYQRLLTFEVPGGGFSWFGQAPANKILTAYGLMEFHDMSNVHDVDQNVIKRTSEWLISQQQADGNWHPDASFINEGATNRFTANELRITAYIAWALENSGYRGPAVGHARQFIADHLSGHLDSYTLAVLANFAVDYPGFKDSTGDSFTHRVFEMLVAARVEKGDQVFWNSEETSVYATGSSAAIETTGLAAQALLKWRQAPAIVRKALTFVASKKDSSGTWGNTQATIMALRALLMASEGSSDASGVVQVFLNGQPIDKLTLTHNNNDLYHQFVLTGLRERDVNNLEITFHGTGGLAYQVVGGYFTPWESSANTEPLSIDVAYDRTKLTQNETVRATATIRNNLSETAKMVMVDLGIPPGFDLLTEDLEDFKAKTAGLRTGCLEKFSLTTTQAILYFNGFSPKNALKLHFRLRAKYPIRASTFQSRVYEYYDPSVSSVSSPKQFEVTRN